jgi:thioredoxin 1
MPETPRVVYEIHDRAAFAEIVDGAGRPALVDFWADWCGPCKITGPHFAAASERFVDQVTFCKVDTERARDVAAAFGIRSLPTIAVLLDGEVVDVHIGAASQKTIEALAERVLAKAQKAERIDAAGGGVKGRLKVMLGLDRSGDR